MLLPFLLLLLKNLNQVGCSLTLTTRIQLRPPGMQYLLLSLFLFVVLSYTYSLFIGHIHSKLDGLSALGQFGCCEIRHPGT